MGLEIHFNIKKNYKMAQFQWNFNGQVVIFVNGSSFPKPRTIEPKKKMAIAKI